MSWSGIGVILYCALSKFYVIGETFVGGFEFSFGCGEQPPPPPRGILLAYPRITQTAVLTKLLTEIVVEQTADVTTVQIERESYH
jgi:hypothetical protein